MDLKKNDSIADDLKFWLNKSHEERVSTVEYLRRQYHGSTARLQRVLLGLFNVHKVEYMIAGFIIPKPSLLPIPLLFLQSFLYHL